MKIGYSFSRPMRVARYTRGTIECGKFLNPWDVYKSDELCEIIPDISYAFKCIGWDGEGELSLIWIPPFLFRDNDEMSKDGGYIWYAKQKENDTSFIGLVGKALGTYPNDNILENACGLDSLCGFDTQFSHEEGWQ